MSDEEIFNETENQFLHQIENFYTAFNFTKLCAQRCNVLKPARSNTLDENETNCLNICGQNVEATKKKFYAKVKEVFNAGGEGDEEE